MRKLLLMALAVFTAAIACNAQENIFNHLGVNVGIGTTGISAGVAAPITNFVQVQAGVSFIPKMTFNASVDGEVEQTIAGTTYEHDITADLEANLARTQGHVIFNIYPFGSKASFFLAAGAYFGGKKIVGLTGHSKEVADLMNQAGLKDAYIEIGDYKLNFDKDANIYGGLVSKNFRPYLGLGFGRPCPKKRIGVMFEIGAQFMGKMNVCEGQDLNPIDISAIANDDDWQKWMNKLTAYPVLKLTLTGRIF